MNLTKLLLYMKRSLLIACFFSFSLLWGQNSKIDSLLILLKTDKEDTNKINHLNKLCSEYRKAGSYINGLNYGKEALALAQKQVPVTFGVKKSIAQANNLIGIIYFNQGNYPEALKSYLIALKIKEEVGDKKGIAASYNNIGNIYFSQNNYPDALKNFETALKIWEEIKDKYGISASYNNIGNIYYNQAIYPLALTNYFASLKIREEIKDKLGISYSYNNIGSVYMGMAEVLRKQNANTDSINSKLNAALKNHFISLRIKEEIGDKGGIASSFINIAAVQIRLNKLLLAKDNINKGLQLSKEIGSKLAIKESYEVAAKLDSIIGDFKAAFTHHKLFIIYRDSIDNEETKKKTIQSSMQYEFDK